MATTTVATIVALLAPISAASAHTGPVSAQVVTDEMTRSTINGPVLEAWSSDRWQKLRAQTRIEQRGPGFGNATAVTYQVSDAQYYWGLKWYKNKYPIHHSMTVTATDLTSGTVHRGSAQRSGSGTASSVTYDGLHLTSGRSYRITTTVRTSGMWWSNDRSSDIVDTHTMVFRR